MEAGQHAEAALIELTGNRPFTDGLTRNPIRLLMPDSN
jgi:hypothetical protein